MQSKEGARNHTQSLQGGRIIELFIEKTAKPVEFGGLFVIRQRVDFIAFVAYTQRLICVARLHLSSGGRDLRND